MFMLDCHGYNFNMLAGLYWNFHHVLCRDKKSGGKNSSHQLNGSGPQNGGKEENGQELKDLEANGTKSQAPISSTSNPWMEMSYQELPYKLKICIKNHFQDESK